MVVFIFWFGVGYQCYNYKVFTPEKTIQDSQICSGIHGFGTVVGNIMFFTGAAAVFLKIIIGSVLILKMKQKLVAVYKKSIQVWGYNISKLALDFGKKLYINVGYITIIKFSIMFERL